MEDNLLPRNDHHVEKVKHFFNMPELYLKNQSLIEVRKIITRNLLKGKLPKNILDLGCGNGSLSLQFLSNSTQVVMVDLSEKMLSIAKMKVPQKWVSNVKYIQSDLAGLQLTPQFDLVLCIGVLAHVSSVERCIEQVASSLMSGGYCVLQITSSDFKIAKFLNLYNTLRNKSGYQFNLMNLSSINSLCQKYGLNYLRSTNYAPLLPGMGLLPNFFLYNYQKYSMLPIFKWISSESMILFQKNSLS